MITKVTNQSFNEFKESNELVMLDFFATWCGHCTNFAPIIDEVDKTAENKCKIGRVDVDEEEELARKFGITSIPTLVFLKNGQIVNKHEGGMNKENLENLINQLNS